MIYEYIIDTVTPNGAPSRERFVEEDAPILERWIDWLGQDRPALCDNEPCAYGDSLALPTGCDVRGFVGEKRSIPALS